MKLGYNTKAKDPTYFIQEGYRDSDGRAKTRKIKTIGKHSELLSITNDPLSYAKREVEKFNKEIESQKVVYEVEIDFSEKLEQTQDMASGSTAKNIGYFFLQPIMGQLHCKDFFREQAARRKMTFDCYEIWRFLTYARILEPRSKHGTFDCLDTYYEQPDFGYHHILRFMDFLAENDAAYLSWLYKKSGGIVERDSSVLYYDCTNFYFETEMEDEEFVDEVTGEILKPYRKYGVSKEHRPNPIIEMGLIMDRRGVPVTMCLHPGNTSEQITAIPLEKEVMGMLGTSKFIYCADAGLGSYNIRIFNSMGGRAFIVTQSIKKLPEIIKEAVFNDYGYKLFSNDTPIKVSQMKAFDKHDPGNHALYNDRAYKKIPADALVDIGLKKEKTYKNGNSAIQKDLVRLPQTVIVTFSRKMMEYQRAVRDRQVERARKLLQSGDPEEIKKGPNDVRRFLKRTAKGKDGKDAEVSYELDMAKVQEEEKYDGYYAVATNLSDSVKDILAISEKRYMIESLFRILKTNFGARPVYHSAHRRITAHFLVCFTALLVFRLLECKLDDQGTHVTAENLLATMRNMRVVPVGDLWEQSAYKGSLALDALVKCTGLPLDRTHQKPQELKRYVKKHLK